MPQERVILRVLGTVPAVGAVSDPDGFRPLVVEANAPRGVLQPGDTVDVVIRCLVQAVSPQPLPVV